MATTQTAGQARARNIEMMGPALGAQYSELWQRVVTIHIYWDEFVELFATKTSRVELLNKAAPAFFNMLLHELWDAVLLRMARLTDKPEVRGQKTLTIYNLLPLIKDESLKAAVEQLIDTVRIKTKFCREWRDLRLAHDDLAAALKDEKARPIEEATKAKMDQALEAIETVMKAVHSHYLESDIMFDILGHRPHGAVELMYLLRDGILQREARRKRIMSGKPTRRTSREMSYDAQIANDRCFGEKNAQEKAAGYPVSEMQRRDDAR
jgi:AbiU2